MAMPAMESEAVCRVTEPTCPLIRTCIPGGTFIGSGLLRRAVAVIRTCILVQCVVEYRAASTVYKLMLMTPNKMLGSHHSFQWSQYMASRLNFEICSKV